MISWDLMQKCRDFSPHFWLNKLQVEDMGPLTVGIDARGSSIYQQLDASAKAQLPQIMATLAQRRDAAKSQVN